MDEKIMSNVMMPMVVEQTGRGERGYDLPSRLMKDRIVTLFTPVHEVSASVLIMQMLYLESQDANKPILFYINSPGGSVSDGMAIYDTMQFIKSPVHTFCMGMAASMGAFLLGAGEKGHRHALPHARIMIHQPSGGASGQQSDIEIAAEQIKLIREELEEIQAGYTGRTPEEVHKASERDNWMRAKAAQKFGIIDKVVTPRKNK